MDWIASPGIWVALVTLTPLEIVLGVDNVIFISIPSGKLSVEQQKRARNVGPSRAMLTRILLLLSIAWMWARRSRTSDQMAISSARRKSESGRQGNRHGGAT